MCNIQSIILLFLMLKKRETRTLLLLSILRKETFFFPLNRNRSKDKHIIFRLNRIVSTKDEGKGLYEATVSVITR